MSDNFEKATNHVLSYYSYKRRSESNAVRNMWLTGFAKFADDEAIKTEESFEKFLEEISLIDTDAEAFTGYQESKQSSSQTPKMSDVRNARLRLQYLAALTQTYRRQYMGADMLAGDRLSGHRYERERKVAAAGLLKSMRERIKKKDE